jgi:hemoglobin
MEFAENRRDARSGTVVRARLHARLAAARTAVTLLVVAMVAATLLACGQKKPPAPPPEPEPTDAGIEEPPPPPEPKSLFERLGGREGLVAVVDTMVQNMSADKRINKLFAKTKGERLEKFKNNMVEQLCQVSGGPCEYKGKDMKAAHKGMGISEAQWDAFVEVLTASLQERNVGQDEQGELLVALGKHRDEVIEKKKK